MFKLGRCWRACLWLVLLGSLPLAGCNTLNDQYTTPTAQIVCSSFGSGAKRCGYPFDEQVCRGVLPCTLGLYRAEVIDIMLTCVDRFERNECPALQADYLCHDPDDQAKLDMLQPTTMMSDYTAAFAKKASECGSAHPIDSTLFAQAKLMRDQLFYESRACLDEPCQLVNNCLLASRQTVSMMCP